MSENEIKSSELCECMRNHSYMWIGSAHHSVHTCRQERKSIIKPPMADGVSSS